MSEGGRGIEIAKHKKPKTQKKNYIIIEGYGGIDVSEGGRGIEIAKHKKPKTQKNKNDSITEGYGGIDVSEGGRASLKRQT